MGKHVQKKQFKFEFNDSWIVILAVIATAVIGDFISAGIILVSHQVFMFFASYSEKNIYKLPDSGYSKMKTICRYLTYAFLGIAIVFAVLAPLKTHKWIECGKIGVVFLLLACTNKLFDALDLTVYRAAEHISSLNISFNSDEVINKLGRVKSLIMNKTATVTDSEYKLVEIYPEGMSESQFLAILTRIESGVDHPVARALGAQDLSDPELDMSVFEGLGIDAKYGDNRIIAGNARFLENNGICCSIPKTYGTAVHMAVNGNYSGYAIFENKTRSGTFDSVEKLRDCGIESLYLLSCDLTSVVQPIAQALGFDVFKAELSSENKAGATDYIVENKPADSYVAYAGNEDYESFASKHADISISLGSFSDYSDICTDKPGLTDLPDLFFETKKALNHQRIILYTALISRFVVLFLLFLGVKNAIPASLILFISGTFTFLISNERI